MNVHVAKILTPTKDINQGREVVSVAVKEQLHEVGCMAPTLSKQIFLEEKGNKQGRNNIKSYAEISKNAKPKEIIKVVHTESDKKSPNSVASTEVGVFQIEGTNITNNREVAQKATQNCVARGNEVEGKNDLNERNLTVRNPISPPNLTVDSSSSLNHSNAQVSEEEAGLLTSQDKKFTS